MKKINYNIFFNSSSTTEATILFAIGKLNFKQFSAECWPKECKMAIKELKRRGYIKAYRSIRKAIANNGYNLKECKLEYDFW